MMTGELALWTVVGWPWPPAEALLTLVLRLKGRTMGEISLVDRTNGGIIIIAYLAESHRRGL